MSKDRYWRAISIDSISPDCFPSVALYLRSGGNYVLYKDPERMFTVADYSRLERNFTEFLYVRSGDMEILNEFMENGLTEMLARDDLSSAVKGKILYQTSVNCVIDMFESPDTAANLLRCRNMVQHMLQHVATDSHALESIQAVVDNNFYIFAHAVQVTALSLLFHEMIFDLAPDEMIDVGVGSLLHDYGMIFITGEILEKNDALSDIEYYKVKQHTQKGYEYLKQSGNYGEIVLNIVRYHHERYDGNGYPTGLKGDDIPRSGQVAAICDVYSALIMDRAHRKANSHEDAIKIMREEAEKGAFNPELFNHFVEIVNLKRPL
ncbi:MAG: HD domain-containing protein [Desulfuromonadaceae bacterium]|nr:HD domain-containing protein [Desulfuromonadaceae bacterium]MDD2849071.1 HD domain-containing protein [Desulfuromonadaceae bacterium]MDD4131771.1 HD domain-containing protein [Desulfuromonadaceae bacterium]